MEIHGLDHNEQFIPRSSKRPYRDIMTAMMIKDVVIEAPDPANI